MPFVNGVYTGISNTFNNAVNGTIIDPADFNELFSDIELALNDLSAGRVYAPTNVVSAATCDIGATDTSRVVVTGSTGPITSLGTSTNRLRFVSFTGTPTLTHHATNLILPGGADITVVAGDCGLFSSDATGKWRCLVFSRSDGDVVFLQAGTGAVERTAQDKMRDWVSILDFDDVDPTGVDSSTAGFTAADAAVAVGTIIYVPQGTYNLGSAPTLTRASWVISPGAVFTGAGANGGATSNGTLEHARGFWRDVGDGANLWRFADRLLVGDAVDYGGQQVGANGPRSWVGLNALGYGTMTYFDVRSQFASYSTIGAVAGAFASRSSDNALGENNTIGVGSFADNDNTSSARSVWSYYGHAVKRSGVSGNLTAGIELDIANQSSASVALDPYQMGNAGTTALAWLGAGGESAQLEPVTHYASNVCIGIVTSGDTLATAWAGGQVISATGTFRQNASKLYISASTGTTGATPPTHTSGTVSDGAVNWTFYRYITPSRFKKGIVFQSIALEGTDGDGTGTAIAMEMARSHELRWKYGGSENANGLIIRADGNSAARQSRLIADATSFNVKGVQSDLTTENTLFRVIAPTITGSNETNFLTVTPTETGGGLVTVSAANSVDTNVSVNVVSKGSGTVQANGAAIYAVGGTDVAVADGGTGLSSGTSGGILGYTAAGVLASSVELTANAIVLGGGAGATPAPLGSLGTTTTVLHGNASGAPTFAAVSLTADVSGLLPVANGGHAASTARGGAANLNLPYTLAHSAVAVSHTGDTNETTLATVAVPASAMGPNGYVEVEAYYSMTGTNSKTPRIRFGGDAGTAYLNAAQTTNVTLQTKVVIANVNSQSSQKGFTNATPNAYSGSTGTGTTSSVDTSAAVDIKLRGILTNTGESITLERYTVRVFYGA